MRVAEAIGRALAQRGVRTFFGLIGSGNFAVSQALQETGAAFYASRHECGAIMMADGYARVTGKVGVCTVHQGPGFTNALTGLVEAAKSRTPLLLLAADTPPGTLWSNFKIDQAAFSETAGAIAEKVRSPETAAADAARSLRRARIERRPVVLNIPIDLVEKPCPDEVPDPSEDGPDLEPVRPSERSVAGMADLVQSSERPVILAGRGAELAGAREALEALGDRIGALLTTTAVGNGLFAGNPYSLGIAGGFSSPLAVELLSQADLVLAFGAALNRWTTRHGTLFPEARVAQVDLDEEAIGALYRTDVGVVGDAAATARALDEELDRRGVTSEGFRGDGLAREIGARRWREEPYEDEGTGAYIDPRTFSIDLDDVLPSGRTVAVDSGHFMGYPAMYLDVPGERGFVFAQGFQSVGLGLANAVGAAIGRPDRLCVAAVGDGGLLMSLGELETAARYGLPMVIAVYNDAAYGAEVHHFGPMGRPVDLATFPETDFAALANAAGAEGVTVRKAEDLAPLKEWLGRRDGPILLDAKVNPEICAEWLEEAFRAH